MVKAEILAPVGGKEQLLAAVRSGADAVYLGTKSFNARRNADNFDEEDLSAAIRYCHGRGVKVHITLNTLIMDSEYNQLVREAQRIAESGADAVIIQDPAVAGIFRECCPDMPIHASTQLTIHNIHGALMAKRLGFSRIVLARELTLDEIQSISTCGLEMECFVHGALCMSLSGACYLSSILGGRSGNRGLCAQPCRLDFHSGCRHYALSLKDMSYISHIRELEQAGVCSFKIEGRMKRPEYVAAAVTACREALSGREPDISALRAVFSRSGFTDGYLSGKRTLNMFGHRTKEDVKNSSDVIHSLTGLYRSELMNIPVNMSLTLTPDAPAELMITDGTHTVQVKGSIPDIPKTNPTTQENAFKNLSKTGGTPFYLRDLTLVNSGMLALPPSELNKMRRDGLDILLQQREEIRKKNFTYPDDAHLETKDFPDIPEIRLRFESYSQIPDNSTKHVIILPIEEIAAHPEVLTLSPEKIWGEMPTAVFPQNVRHAIDCLKKIKSLGLKHIIAGNIGTVGMALDEGFTVHGGQNLNILNSFSLEEWAKIGVADCTLSFELNMNCARNLKGNLPRGIIAYGYLPLMTMRTCPVQGNTGCGKCRGISTLTDRLGTNFTVLCHHRQYTTLLNSLPLHIGEKIPHSFDFITLYFTIESPEQCSTIIKEFESGRATDGKRTKGLYYRELR